SSCIPPRYTRLFGSHTIDTPCAENTLSVGRTCSAHSNRQVKPVQPPPRTPSRIIASGVPRLARCLAISDAAFSVISISRLEGPPGTGVVDDACAGGVANPAGAEGVGGATGDGEVGGER